MTYWNKFKSKLLQIWSRHHLTLYLLNAEWNYFYLKQSRGKWVRLPQQLLKIRYDLYLWCHFIIAENCVIILWLGQLYNTCVHSRCHFAGTIISFIMKNCYENIEPICPGRVTSACSNNDTRCVTLVINPVISFRRKGLWLPQTEHTRGHLWHSYFVEVNQLMVSTVKLPKWWLQLGSSRYSVGTNDRYIFHFQVLLNWSLKQIHRKWVHASQ